MSAIHIHDDTITEVVLNRPEKSNAFDDEMIATLTKALDRLATRQETRVLILRAEGKHFSAGADLQWMQRMCDYSEADNLKDAQALETLMHTLYHFPKPTIALAQGATYGGGLGLLACCDITLASEDAVFCFSEVKLGLIPAVISPYVIAAIGERAARRYFLTAERFEAQEAQRIQLVHEIVSANHLITAGNAIANTLLENGPLALSAAKHLIQRVSQQPMHEALRLSTARDIAQLRISAEGQEGLRAFFDKRPPTWTVFSKSKMSLKD